MSTPHAPSRPALASLLAFAAGLLFAAGLAISGMTQPAKVVGFLDVAGAWDPSLAFVMAGAIAVYFAADRLARRRRAPILAERFDLPAARRVDSGLLTGAALFGVGWGIAGFCPGPGLTSIGAGSLQAAVFVVAMAAGMVLFGVARKGARATLSGDTAGLAESSEPKT